MSGRIRGFQSPSFADRLLCGKKTCRNCYVNTKRRDSLYCTPCEKAIADEYREYIEAMRPRLGMTAGKTKTFADLLEFTYRETVGPVTLDVESVSALLRSGRTKVSNE